jgi:hypothetical protein
MAFYFGAEQTETGFKIGFFDTSIFPAENLPANAVELTAEEYAALMAEQCAGKQIQIDESGKPYAVAQGCEKCDCLKHDILGAGEDLGHAKSGGDLDFSDGVGTLKENAVTKEKLAEGAVSEEKLESVKELFGDDETTELEETENGVIIKIKDGGVNTDKLADAAVNTNKLAAGAVSKEKLANAAVSAEKIAAGAVIPNKLNFGFDPLNQVIGAGTYNDYGSMTSCESYAGGTPTLYLTNASTLGTAARLDFVLDSTAHQPGAVVYVLNTGVYNGSPVAESITAKCNGCELCEIKPGAGKMFFFSGLDSSTGAPVWYPV